MSGYAFHPVWPELRGVVEAIWHTDVPNAGAARSMVLPLVSPILCFHYRKAPLLRLGGQQGDRLLDPGGFRMTGIASVAARIQANGGVGGVMVRLRPEGAARLHGVSVAEFTEDAFALQDVFSPTAISLLHERLLEGPTAVERVRVVQQFLRQRLVERTPDPLAAAAAIALRRHPSLAIRDLAKRLDVGERQLRRRFRDGFGIAPKPFALIVRLGAAIRVRRGGAGWAETAAACGYSDQAHMNNDFSTMVGAAPDVLFRTTSLGQDRQPCRSAEESEFFNTFVSERPTAA